MVLDQKALVEHYGIEDYNAIMRALRTLQLHGFFALAVSMEKMALLDNFELNPESLMKKILDMQQTNRILLTIDGLAGELKERTTS